MKYIEDWDDVGDRELTEQEGEEEEERAASSGAWMPRNCVRVRKVVLTPTRVVLQGPEMMLTNRVIRQFGAAHALRVSFRDDDGRPVAVGNLRMGPHFKADDEESGHHGHRSRTDRLLESFVSGPLSDGLVLGGRRFRFLAWSNSQLRDQGCYFWADAINKSVPSPIITCIFLF